jgi:putative Mn2+ efflux pump MntP
MASGFPGWVMVATLALALAADAFAVALCQGATARPGLRGAVRIGAAFGSAQALMPLLGWALGVAFASLIQAVDHWIAFGLLSALGLRMMKEGLSLDADCGTAARPLTGWALASAAVATSIDAAAAGVTLPTIGAPILIACLMIGLVTLGLSAAAVEIGARGGARLGKRAELFGGLVLILLGAKILAEHLLFGS